MLSHWSFSQRQIISFSERVTTADPKFYGVAALRRSKEEAGQRLRAMPRENLTVSTFSGLQNPKI